MAAWTDSAAGLGYYYEKGLSDTSATPPAGSSQPVTDPAGTYSGPGASAPTLDPPGTYSLAGAASPTLAQPTSATPLGYYVPVAGASYETMDNPGYYTPYAGMSYELPKPSGTFMPAGGHLLATHPTIPTIPTTSTETNWSEFIAVGHGPGSAG